MSARALTHPPDPWRRGLWALVALLCVCVGLLLGLTMTQGRLALLWQQAHTVSPRPSQPTEPAAAATPDAQERVRRQQAMALRARMRTDWSMPLLALEKAASPDIALSTFNLDPLKGSLSLSGEARHMDAILAYRQRLLAAGLTQVDLTLEQATARTYVATVYFEMSAR